MGKKRSRNLRIVVLLWACFLVRGAFYSAVLPLWEGFDEFGHFAYVQRVAGGAWFVNQKTHPSREVERSVELVPMPWVVRDDPPRHETYESYWKLSEEERRAREWELRTLPRSLAVEDAVTSLPIEWPQPPLSYWLMAAVYRMAAGLSLPARVLALRLFNVLLASVAVPMAWIAAERVAGKSTARATAAAVAVMPGLMFDAARVANDPLAIALFSILSVLCLRVVDGDRKSVWWLGLVLGLGLITKAFFLTAVPAIIAVLVWAVRKRGIRWQSAAGCLATAAAIAIPWYVRNLRVTGSVSSVIQDASLRNMPLAERLRHVAEVSWLAALDSTFFSHLWFGGWSFLQLRAWIYHVFALAAMLATIGVAVVWIRKMAAREHIFALTALYAWFCVGLAYHVLMTFLANGISSTGGWYLGAVIVPELVLAAVGLRTLAPAMAVGFALLDLYGLLFVALPYYTGVLAHRANGFLEAFHFARFTDMGFTEVLHRISVNKPAALAPPVVAVLGCAYLLSTAAAGAIALIGPGREAAARRHS